MDERLEEKISIVTAKEVAMFKNVNINVRSMHHRQIVIQQAEKLRDGFFLKTKTSVRTMCKALNLMQLPNRTNAKCPNRGLDHQVELFIWTMIIRLTEMLCFSVRKRN